MTATWPEGFRSSGVACGIKGGDALDLGVIVTERPVRWAGVYTTNAACAAPVRWCRGLDADLRALVVNSGNANACTGVAGESAVERSAEALSERLGCSPAEIAVSSTGPIGVQLPVELVVDGIASAIDGLSSDVEPFARSIMTTDTYEKIATARCGDARLVGVAKGAAMLAPNMATMLAFVVTDADIGPDEHLARAVDRTFNRLSLDACESTNDSVLLLSSCAVPVDAREFSDTLEDLCRQLARMIVGDAEGATRVLRMIVEGAATEEAAVALGKGIAASDLWRAAAHGGDPNWGRILSAMGAVDRSLDLKDVEVALGAESVFSKGEPVGSPVKAAEAMSGPEVLIHCRVGQGPGIAEVLSADLSPDYVLLNAEGSS